MRWRWLIGVPLFLLAGGCGALMTLGHIEAREMFERQRAELTQALQQHGEAFRADVRTTSALPHFDAARAARPGGRDAGPLLAQHVNGLTPKLVERVNVAVAKFPQAVTGVDVTGVDLRWMQELARYDHWELAEERPVRFHWIASPDKQALEAIARVRLLQGLAAGDIKTAGREVEELARLLASTEHWITLHHVAPLLEVVRRAYEHARAEGLDVEGWDPPGAAALGAMKRALHAWGGALDYHVDPALLGDLVTAADLHAGRCAALNDTATTLIEIAPVSGARYEEPRAWVAEALAATKGSCRLTLAREAWSDPTGQRALVVGTDAMCDVDGDPGGCVFGSIAGSFPGMRDALIEASTLDAAEKFAAYAKPR